MTVDVCSGYGRMIYAPGLFAPRRLASYMCESMSKYTLSE